MPTLSDIGRRFDPMREFIQQTQDGLNNLNSQLNNTRQQVHQNTSAIQQMIEMLTQSMNGLREQVGQVITGIGNLSSASARNRQTIQQEAATMDDLWAAYRKMGVEVDDLNLNLKTLQLTEKEINKVVQLGTQYNRQRADSYTALSEKYRAVKILIDNMTVAERENTAEGRNFVAMAREMYEQMNLLQQRTGKYQLQVGDYSKAMTGLNIATNQVVRELPVLANGVSMFAIAISNNIPILVDNIVQVRRANEAQIALKKELLETAAAYELEGNAAAAAEAKQSAAGIKTTSVMAALGKAVFSWQAAIVLVLTVLPGLIRNIEKKRKATEDANKATEDAIKYEELLRKAYMETDKEQVKSISRLQTLNFVTQDYNRTTEDRIKAAQAMKIEFEEEFANFSEEDIIMGRAKKRYDELVDALLEMAKARAYMNKITALQEQMIDQQAVRDAAKVQKDAADAEVARWEAMLQNQIAMGNTGEGLVHFSEQLSKATKQQEEANKAFMKADMPLQDLDNAILKLRKEIPVNGILDEILRGGGRVPKEQSYNVADYYNQAIQALIDGMEDTLQKQLAILDLAWKKEQEEYEKHRMELLRIQRDGNARERQEATTQLENLHFALLTEEGNYIAARQKLIDDMLDSYRKAAEDEGDIERQQMDVISTGLKAEKKLREMAAYEIYEMSDRSAEAKEQLDAALRDSERKYWEDYLADLREAGILTIDEYNTIMSNLAKAVKNGEDKMSRGRKGRRYGGIVEALLAQTSNYGEKNKYGQQVIKEEYANFVTAVDDALKTSMGFMDEWMDKRLEMAKIAVEAAEKEVAAAQKVLDFEMEARANGYANRVETARKELDLEREQHRKALEEQKRLQEQQLLFDSISQTSSLITATANIWEAMTKGTGPLGPGLAIAATALLWGSFAAAKIKAKELAGLQAEQYGEGTVELLEGGSHASGHDIDLGRKKDGTPRRAEGGEFFAVINKRNSRRFRSVIPDVINSFNDGTFGEKYQKANEAMGNFALGLLAGNSPTDVSALERDVHAIKEQGDEHRYMDSMGNTIIRYKNLTRKISKS